MGEQWSDAGASRQYKNSHFALRAFSSRRCAASSRQQHPVLTEENRESCI